MAAETSGRRPGHVPVEHRWLGLDRRTLAPGVAVLALALLWAVVLPAIDEAVPQDREVAAGTVLGAGRGGDAGVGTGSYVPAGRGIG